MFDQFQWILSRWEEVSIAIGQPEILADQVKYQQLLKERAALEPQVAAWEAYQTCLRQLTEAAEMLEDPDLRDVAQTEFEELTQRKSDMEQELRILLLPKDPDDDKNVIMEIRSGTGGDEACLFAADMMRMYTRYAERHGFRVEVISVSDTELGGVKEAVFSLTGQGAFSHMKYESGVHQVKRIPITESNGRIQTSPAPWPCCPRQRRSSSPSCPRICASMSTVPAATAVSASIPQTLLCASPTCPRAL